MSVIQPEGIQNRVREAREKSGYSTRGACRHLGCSYQWLGKMERGERSLSAAWVGRLAVLYKVTTDWLILGKSGGTANEPV